MALSFDAWIGERMKEEDDGVVFEFMQLDDKKIYNRAWNVGVQISGDALPVIYGCPYCHSEFKSGEIVFRFDHHGKWIHVVCAVEALYQITKSLDRAIREPENFVNRHKLIDSL